MSASDIRGEAREYACTGPKTSKAKSRDGRPGLSGRGVVRRASTLATVLLAPFWSLTVLNVIDLGMPTSSLQASKLLVDVFLFPLVLVHLFAVELSSWSSNRAHLKSGAITVCKTKDRAHGPLLVPALLPQAVRSIC